jgi:hypothetical protein
MGLYVVMATSQGVSSSCLETCLQDLAIYSDFGRINYLEDETEVGLKR